ncbi:MAG TPA: carboxypeptidase regulatory-like domain-containing protein, partial [Bryobacteraceae bacterium]|nr:carboxypeptidase regulatory-like domain-containing protein [Bryobacteraceae bacterium]
MQLLLRITALLVSSLLCLSAQTSTSSLSGTLSDPSGALIPDAQFTLTHLATGAILRQASTSAGLFSFPAIPAGAYSLTASKPNFKTLTLRSVTLQVATPLNLDLTLTLGDSSDSISVSASAASLETSNATLGNVIEQRAISSLPLNGRNPLTLLILEPGVSQRSGNTITVNGSRSAANNVTIDGIDANESSNPSAVNNVFRLSPDSVQEFKVTTSNPTPEEGRNSGASISIATRSGTNSLHGRAFHFFRNTALNANEFFAKAQGNEKPDIKLNQYGFDLGGPIRRNRTFFFGSYQGQRINYAQSVDSVFGESVDLYTATARSGIFRYFVADPSSPLVIDGQRITQNSPLLVNSSTGALKPGVVNCTTAGQTNCIASYNIFAADPAGIGADQAAYSVLNSYPLPNSYAAGDGLNTGVYVWNPPIRVRGPQVLGRIDHIVNPNNTSLPVTSTVTTRASTATPLTAAPRSFQASHPVAKSSAPPITPPSPGDASSPPASSTNSPPAMPASSSSSPGAKPTRRSPTCPPSSSIIPTSTTRTSPAPT